MDVLHGTVATAMIGGLIIVAFLLGPRLVLDSGVEENWNTDMHKPHLLRAQNADRMVLETLRRGRQRYAELQAFASGGALVFTGLMMAVIYELVMHRFPA